MLFLLILLIILIKIAIRLNYISAINNDRIVIFISMTILSISYITSGLFIFTQYVLLISILLIADKILEIRYSETIWFVWMLSLLTILYYFYIGINVISIGLSFLMPLSIDKITFLDDPDKTVYVTQNVETERFYSSDTMEISTFLKSLNPEANYAITLEFIPYKDIPEEIIDDNDRPELLLGRPFLINKNSNPKLIATFIHQRLFDIVDYYYLDDSIIKEGNCLILTKYCKVITILEEDSD